MDYRNAFPFYLTYSQYDMWNQMNEDKVQEDFDYLQQMYPAQTKKYLSKISEVLNMMDYEGSMIYDQYPDRMQIMETVDTVTNMVKEQDEDVVLLKELITVLLCYEILKRRHKRNRSMYF